MIRLTQQHNKEESVRQVVGVKRLRVVAERPQWLLFLLQKITICVPEDDSPVRAAPEGFGTAPEGGRAPSGNLCAKRCEFADQTGQRAGTSGQVGTLRSRSTVAGETACWTQSLRLRRGASQRGRGTEAQSRREGVLVGTLRLPWT